MFPTFYTLDTTPETMRVVAHVVWVLLAAYLIYDGYRAHGRTRLAVTLMTSIVFWGVGLVLIETFVTKDRLPEVVHVPLRSWGLMVVLGMCACFLIQRHFGLRTGLSGDQILSIWVYGGLAAAVGARALHVGVNWRDYVDHPIDALVLWDGGMAFIGGALAALLFAALYLRRRGLGLASLDALVLGVALTHAVGRVGCFLAGCCYGRSTESFLGVAFPVGSIAQFNMAKAGLIAVDASTPHVHPTQLYEAAMCLAVGLALLWLHRRKSAVGGTVTAAYLVLYGAGRFLVEMLRGDPERQFAFQFPSEAPLILSTTQSVALVLIPFGLFALARLRRAPSEDVLPHQPTAKEVVSDDVVSEIGG